MSNPVEGSVISVWFSNGVASAIALAETIKAYPQCEIKALNNPVIEEDSDGKRFQEDVSNWLNIEIAPVINPNFPNCSAVEVWEKHQFMSGIKVAPCTHQLKRRARQIWEQTNHTDFHVFGFTSEERGRQDSIVEAGVNALPVLIASDKTKGDCYTDIALAGIEVPRVYKQGYPNGNCKGCVKATSPTYWNHVRKVDPDVFEARAEQSRRLGARLVRVNDKRIFLDELSPTAMGRPMKNMDFECGVFCTSEDAA